MLSISAQFTQLIWKGTKCMGIAFAEYEPEENPGYVKTVIVANYYPGGNVEDKFKENICKPIAKVKYNSEYDPKVQRKIDQYKRRKKRIQSRRSMRPWGQAEEEPGNLD